MDVSWLEPLTGSWWLYPALYLLVVADAFLVVVPSEIAVAGLAALSASTGSPALWMLIPVAAAGALTGDLLCYLIGRAVGIDRWRWQREGRIGAAVRRVRDVSLRRPAMLIFTARYIPFARIAVNLSVGAARLPLARYLPLAAVAGACWALYQAAIGTVLGSVFRDHPVIAVLASIGVALIAGMVVDRVAAVIRRSRRRLPTARRGCEHEQMGTVDEYLAGLSDKDRDVIERVYRVAREVAPDAEQGKGYGMPALVLHGKPLLSVMRTKQHIGVYPFSPEAVAAVAPALADHPGVGLDKGTIRFQPEHPLPDAVVRTLVTTRQHQIEG